MRIRLLNTLLLALLVLAGSRLWTFLREPPPALPVTATAELPRAAEAAEEAAGPEILAARPEAYDVIVARDLFSPTRGVVPPAPVAAVKPAAKPQPVPKVTLSGVVIVDGERSAYLQEGAQDSRPRKVRENENFAGGVVKAIRADGVTFLFAGNEISLPLRKPQDGAGAPLPRGPGPGGAAQRPAAPTPRRLAPTGVQQGQLPIPGRPARLGGVPVVAPAADTEEEIFGDEEFPEDLSLEEDDLDMTEDDGDMLEEVEE